MWKSLTNIARDKYWDFFLLGARFLLAATFLSYGYSKLTDGQFGISDAEMATPLQELSLFRVSWYLFDQQPFKAFIGISQLLCGGLLLVNRTAILGAFLFLPIVTIILLIDLTFMPPAMATAFAWRLGFYIVLDLCILWHYKRRMELIWKAVWLNVNTRYPYPKAMYLLLPLVAIVIEIAGILPKALFNILFNPEQSWAGIQALFKYN